MEHKIVGNDYYICDADGIVIFSISLTDLPNNQIIIKTPKEVYAGPIDLVSFDYNITDEEIK